MWLAEVVKDVEAEKDVAEKLEDIVDITNKYKNNI